MIDCLPWTLNVLSWVGRIGRGSGYFNNKPSAFLFEVRGETCYKISAEFEPEFHLYVHYEPGGEKRNWNPRRRDDDGFQTLVNAQLNAPSSLLKNGRQYPDLVWWKNFNYKGT